MMHFGELDGVPVKISEHAIQRLVEMQLDPEDIKALLLDPDEVFESRKYPGTFCHRKGEHSLGMHKEGDVLVVHTALYATKVAWLKASRDGKLPEDRTLRLDTNIPRF